MRVDNRFTLGVPVDVAWEALQDGDRIARCLPGAHDGLLRVRVGTVAADYEGSVQLTEIDPAAHRLVVVAAGRERDAQGEASATVTAELRPSGSGTAVAITTDLAVSGRLGRFGSGVMGDLAAQLVAQFADRLAADVAARPVPTAPVASVRPPEATEEEGVAPQPLSPPAHPPHRFPARVLPAVAVGILTAMAVSDRRLARWALGAAGAVTVTVLARQARRAASPS